MILIKKNSKDPKINNFTLGKQCLKKFPTLAM